MNKNLNAIGTRSSWLSFFLSFVLALLVGLTSATGTNLLNAAPLTAENISGVVNTYYDVSGVGSGNVTLGGASIGAGHTLGAGDCAVLMEMTGSNIGVHETLSVASVSGSTVSFSSGPSRTYGSGEIQLIHMPCEANYTVSGDVVPEVWDGNLGGVVAIGGGGVLTLAGANIDASCAGFSQANGPNAGSDAPLASFSAANFGGRQLGGSGGGGGIFGGGGAGGGAMPSYDSLTPAAAGSAASDTAPGSGGGTNGADGGAAGLVGNGSSSPIDGGASTSYDYYQSFGGASGGGGGSYGGGAGSCGTLFATAYAAGGGGGGSYTGGGSGALGGTGTGGSWNIDPVTSEAGPDGNAALAVDVPTSRHFLHDGDARLMMGGAGGNTLNNESNDEPIGGNGGGIIILDVASVNGGDNAILANGCAGEDGLLSTGSSGTGSGPGAGYTGSAAGAGGGAGGQMYIAGGGHSDVTVLAEGGAGGKAYADDQHSPAAGGSGGGGGIWFDGAAVADDTNSGSDAGPNSSASTMTAVGTNVHWSVAGGSLAPVGLDGVILGGTTYSRLAWTALYNQAGVASAANNTTIGAELINLGVNETDLRNEFPNLFRINNPKNDGLGCSAATGGTGLVRVSMSTVVVSDVEIGNRVWTESDGNGIADDSGDNTAPVVGSVVTATASDGTTTYTGVTDAAGLYTITVPANDTYTVTIDTPTDFTPSTMPATPGDNQNHNSGYVVTVGEVNDYTIDFGFSPLVDLSLTKTIDNATPQRGDTVVYTLTVMNDSTNEATGVQVRDTLPGGVTYVGHNGGTYDNSTGIWEVGSVAGNNGTQTLEITVTVD